MPEAPHPLAAFDALPDEARVSIKTVAALFGVSNSTVWRRIRAGELPAPKRFGARTTRWRVGDLRQVMRNDA
jgi:excisionase family DNA binding protein